MQLTDRIRVALAVAIAKTITQVVKTLKLGAASVLPGEIARRLHPRLLPLLFEQVKQGVILVVGTNGKTTTSLLLKQILAEQGYRLTHNSTGANLINGLIAALVADTNLVGKLNSDYAILEVDENILPLILKDCVPGYILALNLFRDQLDRYGEVDTIADKWGKAINSLPSQTTIIINADDPTLCYMGQNLQQKVVYFGLTEPDLYLEKVPHAVDSIYCPNCGHALNYQGLYLSHLGDYHCPQCKFQKTPPALDSQAYPQILIGVYNKYNTLAATLTAQTIGIDNQAILNTIKNFRAAFGRAEELEVAGKKVRILLAKNPVGMNETIRTINQIKQNYQAAITLLVLNDRIPDGTDVSWIWDVDMEQLVNTPGTLIVSGDRTYDMALRLEYSKEQLTNNSGTSKLIVQENLPAAISTALSLTPQEETLHIIPTYSAMLEVREILIGRKIL
ncbi:MAG: Mur ligase family protein [Cyanobacteria bacterium J083]|nr:MAG: Mur ligase family protein [Cyanobacteria bacterium J083]